MENEERNVPELTAGKELGSVRVGKMSARFCCSFDSCFDSSSGNNCSVICCCAGVKHSSIDRVAAIEANSFNAWNSIVFPRHTSQPAFISTKIPALCLQAGLVETDAIQYLAHKQTVLFLFYSGFIAIKT